MNVVQTNKFDLPLAVHYIFPVLYVPLIIRLHPPENPEVEPYQIGLLFLPRLRDGKPRGEGRLQAEIYRTPVRRTAARMNGEGTGFQNGFAVIIDQ